MTRTALLALALLGSAGALHAQDVPKKKLYCWVEAGRKVCGDALPANAVDAARTEFNAKNGLPMSQLGRTPTPEEQSAADAAAREEAARAAAAAAEQRRLLAMVESFQTEADLRRAFEARVSLNRDAIKTARMGIEGLRESLVALLKRAGDFELGQRAVPRKLAGDIRLQHGQLLAQQTALANLQREATTLRAQLDEALVRYRELKPQRTPAG